MKTERAMSAAGRQSLTLEEAVAMLPDGETIHTYINGPFMLIGADWSREKVLDAFKKHGAELSGKVATDMGHGIVFWDGQRHVFVETKKAEEPGRVVTNWLDHADETMKEQGVPV